MSEHTLAIPRCVQDGTCLVTAHASTLCWFSLKAHPGRVGIIGVPHFVCRRCKGHWYDLNLMERLEAGLQQRLESGLSGNIYHISVFRDEVDPVQDDLTEPERS